MVVSVMLTSFNEILARVLFQVTETVEAANDVIVQKQSFSELAGHVDRMKPVLLEVKNKNLQNVSEPMKAAVVGLETLLKRSHLLMKKCSSGSYLQLLLNCRCLSRELNDITQEIAKCLDLFTPATLDLSLRTREATISLCNTMKETEFKAAVETEEIAKRLEDAFRQEHINSQNVIRLLKEVAKLTGTSMDASFVNKEIEEIKKEKQELEYNKQQLEAHYLQQMIAFLYRSEMVVSNLGSQTSDAYFKIGDEDCYMRSFLCPITGCPMEDPVDIASGHTFERRAIQDWFNKGNTVCYVTREPLENLDMHPNVSLRDSIQQWKEIKLHDKLNKAIAEVNSHDRNLLEKGLLELSQVIEVASEQSLRDRKGLILRLLALVEVPDDRSNALKCLSFLAKKVPENQAHIADAGGIYPTVKVLADDDDGMKTWAIALLLELSKASFLCKTIGESNECIPQLVKLLNNENQWMRDNVRQVLDNLSTNHVNLIQMAQVNYFKPLIRQLTDGHIESKVHLVSTLAETKMTQNGKTTLVQEGIIHPLVKMLSEGTYKAKLASLHFLEGLSKHPENRECILDANVTEPLFQLVIQKCDIDDRAAIILSNLVLPHEKLEPQIHINLNLLKEEAAIHDMICLLGEARSLLKKSLLQILLGLAISRNGTTVRDRMISGGALQQLLALLIYSGPPLRTLILKLLHTLTRDGNGHYLEENLREEHVKALVTILQGSIEEDKVVAAGILGCLPLHECEATRMLLKENTLQAIVDQLLKQALASPSRGHASNGMVENGLGVLLYFTSLPNTELSKLGELDVVSILVQILSTGTALAKNRAGLILGNLSERTMQLSSQKSHSRSISSFCCPWGSTGDDICCVHRKTCTARYSFCLVKANAVIPLVKALNERDCGTDDAALKALDTLLSKETLENGIKVIGDAPQGYLSIVKLLVNGSPEAKERVLPVLEKLSRHPKCIKFFGTTECKELIHLMQQSSILNKKIASKILGNLGEIPKDSSYM